jgi:hypothetical protein
MTEGLPILMERRGAGLAPKSLIDANALERFPWNKALRVRVTRDRSHPQLRLYWAFLTKVADNLDQDVTAEDLHEFLKLKLGYTKPIKLRSGEIVEVAASIALDRMEQEPFNAYFEAVKDILVTQIIPRMDSKALEREAMVMLGGS